MMSMQDISTDAIKSQMLCKKAIAFENWIYGPLQDMDYTYHC